jgi:acyl-CoA synthetase (AMP-forming)/AMP-acid ligase II
VLGDPSTLRADWRSSGYLSDRTVGDVLKTGTDRHSGARQHWISAERPATATLGEIGAEARKLAAGLIRLGLVPGDVVACQLPNWFEGAVAMQAVFLAELTLVPIVHIYDAAELRHILRDSRARALIMPNRWRKIDYVERLTDVVPLPELEHIIVVDGDGRDGYLTWKAVVEDTLARVKESPSTVSPDDICAIVYTSGTSAQSKGVMHTHNSLFAASRVLFEFCPIQTLKFSPNPAGHLGGLMSLIDATTHGTDTVFMDAWDPTVALEVCSRFEPYFMFASTPFFTSLFEVERSAGGPGRWPQAFGVGGARVPAEIIQDAAKYGRIGFRMYGSSEVPVATSGRIADPLHIRSETDGWPTMGGLLRIVDEDDKELPAGQDGELWLQSPQMFRGYVDASLDSEVITPDGWFRSGDLGRVDDDGLLTITGRKKDIIIRGGENISAAEVEAVLGSHPAVVQTIAISLPDERLGERVCSVVRLRSGAQLGLDEVRKHFKAAGVAIQKVPEYIYQWEGAFPETAEGKVRKSQIQKAVLEDNRQSGFSS